MSTPPNKNEQRRQERLASIARAQSERRGAADSAATDGEPAATTESGGEGSTAVKKTTGPVKATARSGNTTGSRASGTSAGGTSKNPSRPMSASAARTAGATSGATKTPTRPAGGTGARPVGQTKTPTRPTTGASASVKTAKDDDDATGTGTKREARREARRLEIERVRLERKRQLQAKKRKELLVRTAVIGIPAIIIAVLIYLIIQASVPQKPKPFAIETLPMPAAGWASEIQCQSSEQLNQHIHANMQIYFNGKNEPIPEGVGIETNSSGSPTSFCWLHTHDTSGAIHIESPNVSDKYTVGDFLAIWNRSEFQGRWLPEGPPVITSNSFFGQPLDATHKLTVYVNGKVWTGDIHTLVLQSGENIWLEYGTPLVPPKGFDFAGNGLVP